MTNSAKVSCFITFRKNKDSKDVAVWYKKKKKNFMKIIIITFTNQYNPWKILFKDNNKNKKKGFLSQIFVYKKEKLFFFSNISYLILLPYL